VAHSRAGHSHRRWRLSSKKAHIETVRNDINVTPLVDVMLVLLIIFMLMTLIMGRGHDVTLPAAHNYSQEKDKMQPVVSIACVNKPLCDQTELFIEKNKLGPINPATLKEMGMQIEAAWKAPKNPDGVGRVYIKADEGVTYKDVYPVLTYLNKELQLQQIDLAIAKDSEEK
jgi:biopolymer transport protein ExbD